MTSSIFSHRPWSESEAQEQHFRASSALLAKAVRNRRINNVVMALIAFCIALGGAWIDRPSAPFLLGAAGLLVMVALSFARSGMDADLELRRWEFDAGYPPAPPARIESLLADTTLPAEVHGAIRRWQALGYTLRLRDIDFLLALAGRTDADGKSDAYFNYVLLRNEP